MERSARGAGGNIGAPGSPESRKSLRRPAGAAARPGIEASGEWMDWNGNGMMRYGWRPAYY